MNKQDYEKKFEGWIGEEELVKQQIMEEKYDQERIQTN